MNKNNILLNVIIIVLIILLGMLGILLYKSYYENNDSEKIHIQTIDMSIPTYTTITRIGILSSNGKHFEVTKNEDIQKIISKLNTLRLELDKNAETDNIPGFRYYITLYTLWDRVVWEGAIVNEHTIKYDDAYYLISKGSFNITDINEILEKLE